jgi:hypothetical protein
MSADEVSVLRDQIAELRERVVRLETYVKVMGALATIVPLAIQIYQLVK